VHEEGSSALDGQGLTGPRSQREWNRNDNGTTTDQEQGGYERHRCTGREDGVQDVVCVLVAGVDHADAVGLRT